MHSPLPPKSGATPGSRRRKSSRSRKSNENAAPRGSNVPTPNRFGFKKRLGSVAATPPATLGQLDEESGVCAPEKSHLIYHGTRRLHRNHSLEHRRHALEQPLGRVRLLQRASLVKVRAQIATQTGVNVLF